MSESFFLLLSFTFNQITCKYRRRRLATFPWRMLQSPCLNTTRFRTRRDENLVCRYLKME